MTKVDNTDLAETLKSRIRALAATHDLLTTRDWRGAALQDILKSELMPFEQTKKVRLNGPPVELPSKHALSLTLTLHELTTNAAKYGALSKVGGTLDINWLVTVDGSGREITINWQEAFASPINLNQLVESFGTRLIKNAVVHDLRGACDHRLGTDGLT